MCKPILISILVNGLMSVVASYHADDCQACFVIVLPIPFIMVEKSLLVEYEKTLDVDAMKSSEGLGLISTYQHMSAGDL